MMVQWTTYVILIWTLKMDYVPIDRLFYVDLDCPNGGQSNQSCRVLPKFGRPPTIWEISKAKKNMCYF